MLVVFVGRTSHERPLVVVQGSGEDTVVTRGTGQAGCGNIVRIRGVGGCSGLDLKTVPVRRVVMQRITDGISRFATRCFDIQGNRI